MTASDQPQEALGDEGAVKGASSLRDELARAIDQSPFYDALSLADAVLVVVRARAEQLAQEVAALGERASRMAQATTDDIADASWTAEAVTRRHDAERIRGLFNEGNR